MIAIIPLKKTSLRVPNKNFKPFGDTRLIDLKIKQLRAVKGVDRIIINTDCKEIAKEFEADGIECIIRDSYYTTCSGSEFFENIAETAPDDVLIYSPVTSPFIKPATLQDAIDKYNNCSYDCVTSVFNMKHHAWMNDKPVNYDPYNSPNSQDLPTMYKITYGFGILSRGLWIENRNIVTGGPYQHFYELDEIEAVDIDTELDFKFAEYLYEKGLHNM